MTDEAMDDEACPECGIKPVRGRSGKILIQCGGHVALTPEEGTEHG